MLEIPPLEAFTIQLAESGRFVDASGAPYTPSPEPTVTVRRLNVNGSYEELTNAGDAVQVVIGVTPVVGVFKYTGSSAWAVDGTTLDILLTTSDAALVALGRFFTERRLTVKVTASADLSGIVDDLNTLLARTVAGVTFISFVEPVTGNLTLFDQDLTEDSGITLPSWSSQDWLPYDLSNAVSITLTYKKKDGTTGTIGTMEIVSDTQIKLATLTKAQAQALPYGKEAAGVKIVAVLDAAHGDDTVELVNAALNHYNYRKVAGG